MANVEEAKTDYLEAKQAAEGCQESIRQLQMKVDDLEGSLPGLNREIEAAERSKVSALDAFALNSNKQAEAALKAARQAHDDAQKKLSESNELIEACSRAFKKQESKLGQLNNACDLAKRACWQAVADEIRSKIPGEVFENVRSLFVIGRQTGQTRQWILDSLFPNIPPAEFQTIRNELVKKYGMDE